MTASTMNTYAEFASVFDTIGLEHAGLQALQRVQRSTHQTAGRSLDLGCGTGLAMIELANAGWDATGIDSSSEMLHIAEGRARDAGVRVTLVEGDLLVAGGWWLEGGASFDLITCLGDTLSELHEAGDLERLCRSCASLLTPGGLLAFDTRTPAEYATWDARDEVLSDADGLLVYTERDYHPYTDEATCRYAWFASDGRRWWRSEETHSLRLWRPEAISAALSLAGLERELEHNLGDGRVLYLARKRAGGL